VSEIPPDLHYTAEHEWIRRTGDDTVRVGITDFAQEALGDVVFVRLPDVGSDLSGNHARRTGAEVGRRSDVAADPAGEGTLGSCARYGRHIDGHSGWEAGRPDPTRQRSSGQ